MWQLIHLERVSARLTNAIQVFLRAKTTDKSFLSFEGASKDLVTGSIEDKTQQPCEAEEYPMGEWNPLSEFSYIIESLFCRIEQAITH